MIVTTHKTVDPVSGAEVDTGSKYNSYFMGKAYYFASVENKLRFDRDPQMYLKRPHPPAAGSSGGGRSQ